MGHRPFSTHVSEDLSADLADSAWLSLRGSTWGSASRQRRHFFPAPSRRISAFRARSLSRSLALSPLWGAGAGPCKQGHPGRALSALRARRASAPAKSLPPGVELPRSGIGAHFNSYFPAKRDYVMPNNRRRKTPAHEPSAHQKYLQKVLVELQDAFRNRVLKLSFLECRPRCATSQRRELSHLAAGPHRENGEGAATVFQAHAGPTRDRGHCLVSRPGV